MGCPITEPIELSLTFLNLEALALVTPKLLLNGAETLVSNKLLELSWTKGPANLEIGTGD